MRSSLVRFVKVPFEQTWVAVLVWVLGTTGGGGVALWSMNIAAWLPIPISAMPVTIATFSTCMGILSLFQYFASYAIVPFPKWWTVISLLSVIIVDGLFILVFGTGDPESDTMALFMVSFVSLFTAQAVMMQRCWRVGFSWLLMCMFGVVSSGLWWELLDRSIALPLTLSLATACVLLRIRAKLAEHAHANCILSKPAGSG